MIGFRSLLLTLTVTLGFQVHASAQGSPEFLHFKPHDHALGDVHPYFRDGECFLYYLKPGKYEAALARSKDWLNWKETAIEHAPVTAEDWMSPYYVLGVVHDPAANIYRSFYGHAQGRMASSVSGDLIHWSCAPKEYHVPAADYYQRRRDPFVFWIPEMKQWGCVMTTWMKGLPKESAGAVSLSLSPDLKKWTEHGQIVDPGNIGEPECPQMFKLGGRWYLLASIYDRAVGAPVYWTAERPQGPWSKAPVGALDGKDLCAAQIAFDGETPFLFGWVPLKESRPGKQHWGGHLALPREVYAMADGRLGTRLAAKVASVFDALPLSKTVTSKKLAARFNVELTEPKSEVRIKMGPLGDVVLTASRLAIVDAAGEIWSDLPVELPTGTPLAARLYVDRNIVELFVADHYSLAAKLPERAGEVEFKCDAGVSNLHASEWVMPR